MLVVFNHAGLLAVSMDSPLGDSWLVSSHAVAEMGAIGVDLFFVISGFVMSLSARRFVGPWGASTFLALRFVRIAPLFYLASALMLANLIRAGIDVDPSSLLNSITFIPVFDDETYSWPLHYLGWTLAFEFAFYFLVSILICTGGGARPVVLLAMTAIAPLLGFLLAAESAAWKVFTNPILWEFGFGVLAFILWERCQMRRLLAPFSIFAATTLLALIVALWMEPDWLAANGWDGPTGGASGGSDTVEGMTSPLRALYWGLPMFLVFCAVVGSVSIGKGLWATTMKLLGDASYSIYLSHLFVIMAFEELVERVGIHPDLVLVTALASSALVGVLVYRLVEKPLLAKGQRRVRQWTLQFARQEA